jgi:hypothetical protein
MLEGGRQEEECPKTLEENRGAGQWLRLRRDVLIIRC